MINLQQVYARFYRSLNFDYLRKSAAGYVPDPWDTTPGGANYPFVRVRLERDITTVVGANEAGKSQLLGAIKSGLTGVGIERRDFCRYSPFFSTSNSLVVPEFGLEFDGLGDEERGTVARMCGVDVSPDITHAAVFRVNETPKLRIYLRGTGADWSMHNIKKPTLLKQLGLPQYFEIDSRVPLPDAVPLEYLAKNSSVGVLGKDGRRRLFEAFHASAPAWFSSPQALQQNAETVVAAYAAIDAASDDRRQYELASDLLIKVVGLERDLFVELQQAVAEGRNGYAAGIIERINAELATRLNFSQWWSQDSFFELLVDLRDYDIVFLIRDRTGTSYSFDERSEGLKYFLSYFVQYLSHEAPEDGQPEILLMDEPDAFLSASGQQDLLRIFAAFAHPEEVDTQPIQVVYVTHSPFLIDKNHAERIRVLEKGEHDEGTRVVANASRNHYEPLRSAFGSFVGETTFIGNCNLLLEGSSDQILIAGLSSWLATRGTPSMQRLDLNSITLVPAGGAPQIPYLAFLARGRDVDRPPVIVLLDGDNAGDEAAAALARGGPRRKQLVAPQYVLQLSDESLSGLRTDSPAGACCIEDLVPLDFTVRAVRRYCAELVPDSDMSGFAPDAATVFAAGADTHAGLEAALRAHLGDGGAHLDKVGLARAIVAVLSEESADVAQLAAVEHNFRLLLSCLARLQRAANRSAGEEKIRSRVNRVKRRFMADHSHSAKREDVVLLIEEIEGQLDNTVEADEIRATLRQWTRDLRLEEEPRNELDDFPAFINELTGLAYAGIRAVQTP